MATLPDTKLYIDGAARDAEGGRTYDNVGPWTGESVGRAADATPADVDAAIAAARRAFDETDWSTDHGRRLELVRKLYDLFVANTARLGEIAMHEAGATLLGVDKAHVTMAMEGWKDLIDLFPRIEWSSDRGQREGFGVLSHRTVVQEAIGVVAAITPWNVPLYVNAEKVVSALLAGCTVILKPAPDTPAMGAIFGELAIEAGFPAGVLQVITAADPAEAGEMLVTDPRVDLVTFTGSTGIGRRIMEKGAATLKRVFLELGGKSAKIVLEDAPDFAMEVASSILVFHAGQGCAVQSRLLVPRSRYEEAVRILQGTYAHFADKWGDIADPAHPMGPVISARQRDRVLGYIEIGRQEGARLIAGGGVRTDLGGGYFVEPTCFVDVTNDMRIAREEIFGPVLVVIPYEDEDDAVRIANESDYGLSGGIATADLDRGLRLAARIRTGSVSVNGGMCIAGDLPFGGYKVSGIGRAWGVEGIEEYLEKKVVAYRVAEPATA